MVDLSSLPQALWAKGLPLDAAIHRFTVGDDPRLDRVLLAHDCVGSAAHARGLQAAGLLSATDTRALIDALGQLHRAAQRGEIDITAAQEDAHTAIEQALVARIGEAGKRIHLGRSRNDQVLLALRLWLRHQVVAAARGLQNLIDTLLALATTHEHLALPGYTHLRRAMPSSLGQWAAGYIEGLLEELQALDGVWTRIDRCPLGAAAGFGVPLPLNRDVVAQMLGFSRVQRAPVDAMNSRGRHEQALLDAYVSIAQSLEKLIWDLSLYSTDEFGFVRLPDAFTTGSSIMPQKRNPDVLELARARCRELRGLSDWHRHIVTGLPGSYHRDFQLHKQPLFAASDSLLALLDVLARLIPGLQFDAAAMRRAMSPELYATHAAIAQVRAGATFRDAYRAVGGAIASGTFEAPQVLASDTHIGGLEQLGLDSYQHELNALKAHIDARAAKLADVEQRIFTSIVSD